MDYEKLGLRVGLELHRQLETHKLFCACPSVLHEREADFKIKRYLRASKSELLEKDVVAEFEEAKGRYAIYEGYHDNTCLVELDEFPPYEINKEALNVALQVAMLLNMKIVDAVQVMRKQVLDYSNTSGFQRTALIARNGYIIINNKEIPIQTLCLEEDAARKISETKEYVVYRLDRLGIPLIEIATAPHITLPEEAKEVAAFIGMVLKSTGKVKSGIGSIRQDLNVSIAKGARIEIKGVQDLKSIPKVIELEVERQLELIKRGKKVVPEVRKANPDCTTSFLRPMPSAARMYVETDHPIIPITKEMLSKIKLPELLTEKAMKLEKDYGIASHLAREIVEKNISLHEFFVKGLDYEFIAKVLVEMPKELKSRYSLDASKLHENHFKDVLKAIAKYNIPKKAALEMLADIIKHGKFELKKYTPASLDEVEKYVKEVISKHRDLSFNALMGMVMKKFYGKVDGKKVAELIKKHFQS